LNRDVNPGFFPKLVLMLSKPEKPDQLLKLPLGKIDVAGIDTEGLRSKVHTTTFMEHMEVRPGERSNDTITPSHAFLEFPSHTHRLCSRKL